MLNYLCFSFLLLVLYDFVLFYFHEGEWLHLNHGIGWLPAVVSCSHKVKARLEAVPDCIRDPGNARFEPLINAFDRDSQIREQDAKVWNFQNVVL